MMLNVITNEFIKSRYRQDIKWSIVTVNSAIVWLTVHECSSAVDWTQADNTWCNTKNKIVLSPTSLLHLTEVERVALQKIALGRLQDINLGVPITIPKGNSQPAEQQSHNITVM